MQRGQPADRVGRRARPAPVVGVGHLPAAVDVLDVRELAPFYKELAKLVRSRNDMLFNVEQLCCIAIALLEAQL